MYSKTRITELFCSYCETPDDHVFELLIMECKPMIRTLLTKYAAFMPFEDDIIQEVQIKMWNTLRKPERLRMNKDHPVSFLFFRLWPYLYNTLERYSRMNNVPLDTTPAEREVIEVKEKDGLTWEQIAEIRHADIWTVRCMYYIGKQKQRRSMGMLHGTYTDEVSDYQATFVDPMRRWEVLEAKKLWKKDVSKKLLQHPVYGRDPELRAQVQQCFERLAQDELGELDGEESTFGEGLKSNSGGVS